MGTQEIGPSQTAPSSEFAKGFRMGNLTKEEEFKETSNKLKKLRNPLMESQGTLKENKNMPRICGTLPR